MIGERFFTRASWKLGVHGGKTAKLVSPAFAQASADS